MNNFDDLFEQQPQAEAAPQKQESQKERPKRQWWQVKEEKQRKEAYATLDRIFGEFSAGTGSMEAYLDVQSRFPFHSARNALLIGDKCPDAVRVGGYKEWHAQGIEILEDEKRLPIIILEPGKAYRREDGSVGQNFYAKEVYDISQTTARDQVQPQVSYDDRLLLKGLIASSPVPIRAVEELPQGRGAMFSAEQNAILVKKAWTRRTSSAVFLWRLPTCSLPKAWMAIPGKRTDTKPMRSAICSASGMAWTPKSMRFPNWTAYFRGRSPGRIFLRPSPICGTPSNPSMAVWPGLWASPATASRKNRNGKGGVDPWKNRKKSSSPWTAMNTAL